MVDWEPVISALAVAIPLLSVAIANYLKTRENRDVLHRVERQTNGGLTDIQRRLAALELHVRPGPAIQTTETHTQPSGESSPTSPA